MWSWAYPCGNCAGQEFIQRKIAQAGYLIARAYPDELQGLHAVPDLQTYAYAARYTQVVQKGYPKKVPGKGEVTISGRTTGPAAYSVSSFPFTVTSIAVLLRNLRVMLPL